jgi:YVTN family beta-propeller protein
LGTLLASLAYPQYLETTIKLPDTLGPLTGPYHLAWDENPAHPRLYIGGEGDSGGVIVAQAITCNRLARVSTGPVKALCFVPPHGKLYVARSDTDSLMVVDCATNQVTSVIHTSGGTPVMQYNNQNDRLYCGGDQISVIDCAADSMTCTIPVAASAFSYDSAANKLYVGRNGPLAVIDCASDSVVASLPEVGSAIALCFNPTAQKVYAATIDTLFAIRTDGDSIVARLPFDSLKPTLACDPQRNRVYCSGSDRDWGILSSIDCTADTVLWTSITILPMTFLACNTSRDLLYVFFTTWYGEVFVYDATTGERLARVTVDGIPQGGGWSPGLDRLYCLPLYCVCAAVDGSGDSIAGIVPLTIKAENIVLDTVHNRLYFTYASGCGCVGVVDCAQNFVTSYIHGGTGPHAICCNPNNDRLYWSSGGQSMTAYDCSTNTRIGTVNMSGSVRASRLHLGLNKLYAYARDTLGNDIIDVIDCERDSVIQSVYKPDDGSTVRELLLVPEDNTLWLLSVWSVAVVDCLGDSIVYAAPDTLGSINDACACPEDRRIYTGGEGNTVRSVNMDKPEEVDTLHERIPESGQMRFLDIPGAHKAYWSYAYPSHWPGSSHIFAIDTRTNTLVDSFWVGQMISDMCLDHTGSFVYCAALTDSALLVIDARVDSVVATVRLPPSMAAKKNSLVLNRATNRIYVAQYDEYRYGDVIPVIRDSMLIGVTELKPSSPSRCVGPTVVNRGTPMRVCATSELWDATGRRAAILTSGPNDISRLAPGVYFVRGPETEDGRPGPAVRKVVLTE